jgi:hypothetical protein
LRRRAIISLRPSYFALGAAKDRVSQIYLHHEEMKDHEGLFFIGAWGSYQQLLAGSWSAMGYRADTVKHSVIASCRFRSTLLLFPGGLFFAAGGDMRRIRIFNDLNFLSFP